MIKPSFEQKRWGGLVCTNINEILSVATDTGLGAHQIAKICGIQPTSLSKWRRDNRARASIVQPLIDYLNSRSAQVLPDTNFSGEVMKKEDLKGLIEPLKNSIAAKTREYFAEDGSKVLPMEELQFLKLLQEIA